MEWLAMLAPNERPKLIFSERYVVTRASGPQTPGSDTWGAPPAVVLVRSSTLGPYTTRYAALLCHDVAGIAAAASFSSMVDEAALLLVSLYDTLYDRGNLFRVKHFI